MSVDLAAVRTLATTHAKTPGGLMPALHAVQDALGHVPEAAVPVLADVFNLSRAEVHGVVSYYHHFRRTPPGRHVLEICRAESCKSLGADALVERAKGRLGCDLHETSADGACSLEPVYCLGLCASSPAAMLDGRPIARLSPEKMDRLIDGLRETRDQAAAVEATR